MVQDRGLRPLHSLIVREHEESWPRSVGTEAIWGATAHLVVRAGWYVCLSRFLPAGSQGISCAGAPAGYCSLWSSAGSGSVRETEYISSGKETDRKWEEGEDPSVLEFTSAAYGRNGKVLASEEVKLQIKEIGINSRAHLYLMRGSQYSIGPTAWLPCYIRNPGPIVRPRTTSVKQGH